MIARSNRNRKMQKEINQNEIISSSKLRMSTRPGICLLILCTKGLTSVSDVVVTLILGLHIALFHLYERVQHGLISQGFIAAQCYAEKPVFLISVKPTFL